MSASEKVTFLLAVFTLQSIKSRIETRMNLPKQFGNPLFLLYSPLNQGLKPLSIKHKL